MTRLIFTVYGSPVAQGRPRFSTAGGFPRAYDPAKSRSWKADVKAQVIAQMDGGLLFNGPIRMTTTFHLPKPKSTPKRVKHHVKKPDLDNLLKGVKDALKGIVYRDDSQVVESLTRKVFGDPPRVVIGVELMDEIEDAYADGAR